MNGRTSEQARSSVDDLGGADQSVADTVDPWDQRESVRGQSEDVRSGLGDEGLTSSQKKGGTGPETETGTTDANAKKAGYPKTVVIGSEKVRVASADEEKQAKAILEKIKKDYGIDVSSQKGVDAIKKDYTRAPDAVKKGLKTKYWAFKELVALQKALAHFAPILGDARTSSGRKGVDQEITSVSKVAQGIDRNSSTGKLDTTTMGEFFADSKNFSMFTAGTDSEIDFPGDNAKQLEGTAIHEIAHGLLKHEVAGYASALDYWTDEATASGTSGAEAPITAYGQTNAGEDLSEAVMYYFTDKKTLESKCPKRHALIKKMVESWTPKSTDKGTSGMGDFPNTLNDGTTAFA